MMMVAAVENKNRMGENEFVVLVAAVVVDDSAAAAVATAAPPDVIDIDNDNMGMHD
jgi:hypothetical protein